MAASDHKAIIAFGEGGNPDTIQAAYNLAINKICKPILLGARSRIFSMAESKGIDLNSVEIEVVDYSTITKNALKTYAEKIYEKTCRQGMTYEDAE